MALKSENSHRYTNTVNIDWIFLTVVQEKIVPFKDYVNTTGTKWGEKNT